MNPIELIALSIQVPRALPVLWWTPPGWGKTQMVQQLAEALDAHLETMIASIAEPSDFGGLLVPDGRGGVARLPLGWALRANETEKKTAIIFCDEASSAPPATQAAMLRVVNEGVTGDYALKEHVRFCLAANPADLAAGGWDLAPAMANRFLHVEQKGVDADAFVDYHMSGSKVRQSIPRLDLDAWERMYERTRALMTAFIRRRPDLLAEDAKRYAGRFPLSFASPRTWENAARMQAGCMAAGMDDAVLPCVVGSIGEPSGLEYLTFVKMVDLPDPDELLEHPEMYSPDPKRPDRDYCIVNAVAAAAIRKQKDPKVFLHRWERAWEVLCRGMSAGKDIVVTGARTLAASRPKQGMIKDSVRKTLMELSPVLRSSGLMD